MPELPPQTVNYTALKSRIRLSRGWLTVLIASAVLIMAGFAVAGVSHNPALSAWGGFFSVLGIFLLGISGAVCAWQYLKGRQAQELQFITDNGWLPYNYDNTAYVATSLLGIGYDQRIVSGFTGRYRGFDIHGVHYEYTTGSGKSQQTHHFVDLHFSLPETLPLIVLDSKHNRALGVFNDLPERIPGGKTLQLEGDFNDEFATTVMPGSEQQVLQFLTPDFMQALIAGPDKTDIEMEADNLFVIYHGSSFRMDSLQQLFGAADIVLSHVSKTSKVWQASSSAEQIESMAATALAPRAKLALSGRHVTIGTVIGIIVFIIIQILHLIGLRHQ